jgi:hypothetical protein
MTKKNERSVLHAVYELLPVRLWSVFFVRTARDWHEHCTSIPTDRERQKAAYEAYASKQRSVLNGMLIELWG